MAALSASLLAFLTSLCFISVSCQVVVPSKVAEGQPFTVYCDASRVDISISGVYILYYLKISRRVSTTLTEVAMYTHYMYTSANISTIKHDDRDWNFTFTGDTPGLNNRETMKIVWEVLDTKCEDAGTYVCEVYYPVHIGSYSSTQSADVIVTGGSSRFKVSAYPQPSDLLYREGAIVTLTCKLTGPDTLNLQWEKWVPSSSGAEQLESLPSDAVIANKTTRSPLAYGYCSDYDSQSTLTFRVDATYEQETYKCIVSNNSQEVERGNITIDILPKERPIVDAQDPRDVETFTITCDASRVTVPHSEGRAVSINELVLEARLGSSQTFDKIAQYVSCGPPESLEYEHKIPGRDWVFNFTGSKCGENNMATMRIEIQVRDPKHTDAGLYRCTVRYFSAHTGLVDVSQEYNLTTSVLPIVNNETLNNGSLIVKCDARRVEVPGPNINPEVVGALVVQAKLGTSQAYTKIAEYLSYGPQENLQFQNPPPGSDWIFTFAGSNNGVNNRKTMSLDIEVKEARCDDVGTYMCQVMFYSSEEGTAWLYQEQNVIAVC